jgi:hypothetical protein
VASELCDDGFTLRPNKTSPLAVEPNWGVINPLALLHSNNLSVSVGFWMALRDRLGAYELAWSGDVYVMCETNFNFHQLRTWVTTDLPFTLRRGRSDQGNSVHS